MEFCGKGETPLHNQFRKIRVPILYVGGAGGFGRYGEYTASLTASQDVTSLIVQDLPDEERPMDYGHADLVAAGDAEWRVWEPILEWIFAHR